MLLACRLAGLWRTLCGRQMTRNAGRLTQCLGPLRERLDVSQRDTRQICWVLGGSLLEGGHVVVGRIEGAETDDVGKAIDVTLSPDGETAYTRDIRLAVGLIVVVKHSVAFVDHLQMEISK